MSDLALWISGGLILAIFTGVVWINRKRMRGEVSRMRGGNPDFQALATELRRSNDMLEKTLQSHEARLKILEETSISSADRNGPGASSSLN